MSEIEILLLQLDVEEGQRQTNAAGPWCCSTKPPDGSRRNEAVAAKPSGSDGEHTMRRTADAEMQDPIEAGRISRTIRSGSRVDPQKRLSPVRKRKECQ